MIKLLFLEKAKQTGILCNKGVTRFHKFDSGNGILFLNIYLLKYTTTAWNGSPETKANST